MTTEQSASTDPSCNSRCDFCDVTLNSDYEVCCHLSSNGHIAKRKEFLAKYTAEKTVASEGPVSLDEVLKSLKIYNPKDVEAVANKGFFKVTDDNVAIAEEFSILLIGTIHDYLIQGFPPQYRDFILQQRRNEIKVSLRASRIASPKTTPDKPADPVQSSAKPQDVSKEATRPVQVPRAQQPQPVAQSQTQPQATSPTAPAKQPTIPATKPTPVPAVTQRAPALAARVPAPALRLPGQKVPPVVTPAAPTRPSVSDETASSKRRQPEPPASTSETRTKKTKTNVQPKPIDTGFIKPKTKQVVPEKDPTFVPVLAKIKIEPKDK